MEDYSQLVQEVVQPGIMETVFNKKIEDLKVLMTADQGIYGGASITRPIRTSVSSNAAAYTKSDVDPVAGTFVGTEATWTKLYYHTTAEVSGIDISQAQGGGQTSIANLIQDAVAIETEAMWEVIFDAFLAQLLADIDSSGTAYSDASLNRSTYATLASTENTTDTPITLALLQAHSNSVRLNKKCGPKSGYTWMMETAVYERFEPLAGIQLTHNIDAGAQGIAAGQGQINTWNGERVVSPTGMTTGSIYYARQQDMKYKIHRPLTVEQVPSERDSAKFVVRVGINNWVENPGFCGKMLSKD